MPGPVDPHMLEILRTIGAGTENVISPPNPEVAARILAESASGGDPQMAEQLFQQFQGLSVPEMAAWMKEMGADEEMIEMFLRDVQLSSRQPGGSGFMLQDFDPSAGL